MGRGQIGGRAGGARKRSADSVSKGGEIEVDGETVPIVNIPDELRQSAPGAKTKNFYVLNSDGSYTEVKGYVEGNVAFYREDFAAPSRTQQVGPGSYANDNTWAVVHAPTGKVLGIAEEGVRSDPRTGAEWGGWRLSSLREKMAPELNGSMRSNGTTRSGVNLAQKLEDFMYSDLLSRRESRSSFRSRDDDFLPF